MTMFMALGTLSLGAITLIALMRGPDAKTRSSPRDTPIDAGAAADIAQKSTRLVDLSGNSGLLLPANLGDLRVNPSIVQLDLSDCSLTGMCILVYVRCDACILACVRASAYVSVCHLAV